MCDDGLFLSADKVACLSSCPTGFIGEEGKCIRITNITDTSLAKSLNQSAVLIATFGEASIDNDYNGHSITINGAFSSCSRGLYF